MSWVFGLNYSPVPRLGGYLSPPQVLRILVIGLRIERIVFLGAVGVEMGASRWSILYLFASWFRVRLWGLTWRERIGWQLMS